MDEKPNYFRVATGLPAHGVVLVFGTIGSLVGLFRGLYWPLLLFGAAEAFYLLILPSLPPFRSFVDARAAAEKAHRLAVDLERIAGKLSPNAKSRLDALNRTRDRILDALRAMGAPQDMERQWRARLDEVAGAALRLLVAVDSTRVDDRDQRLLDSEVRELHEEIAKGGDGPAKAARQQRLELLEKRAGGTGLLKEQRDAAVVQFETLEDLFKELSVQALAGRDAQAFSQRLQGLQAQIDAASQTVAALDRHAATSSELAELKVTR
jgi:hypothetical protein